MLASDNEHEASLYVRTAEAVEIQTQNEHVRVTGKIRSRVGIVLLFHFTVT